MSTNYYIGGEHIGKRSDGGLACDACGIAKVVRSDDMHVEDGGTLGLHGAECPRCGEPWSGRAASFIWTALHWRWAIEAEATDAGLLAPITDEYGASFTAAEFLGRLPRVTIHRLVSQEFL